MIARAAGHFSLPAVLLWAIAIPGCSHPVQRQLEGTWHGDSVENFEDRDLARVTGWAKSLRLSFSGSRISVAIAAEDQRTGKYQVRSVHNSDVVLAVTRPDGKSDMTRLKLDGDHSIRWILGDGRSIVLRREL